MSPKIVDKKLKKESLLQAAMKAFARTGYADTTMESIADKAGVSKGILYEYFENKETLFFELYAYFEQMYKTRLIEKIEGTDDPKKKLKLFIEYSFEIYSEFSDFINLMFFFWAEGMLKKSGKNFNLQEIYTRYRKWVAGMIKDGIKKDCFQKVDPYVYASVIFGAMDGLCLQWILDMKNFPIGKASRQLSRTVLKGLEKTDPYKK